jgi:hypothetical protein
MECNARNRYHNYSIFIYNFYFTLQYYEGNTKHSLTLININFFIKALKDHLFISFLDKYIDNEKGR